MKITSYRPQAKQMKIYIRKHHVFSPPTSIQIKCREINSVQLCEQADTHGCSFPSHAQPTVALSSLYQYSYVIQVGIFSECWPNSGPHRVAPFVSAPTLCSTRVQEITNVRAPLRCTYLNTLPVVVVCPTSAYSPSTNKA